MSDLKDDYGQLWENFLASERRKYQQYKGSVVNNFFWRTYDRQEIDWIEESGGRLNGFEFRNKDKGEKAPAAWTKAYPSAGFEVIDRDKYFEWLS